MCGHEDHYQLDCKNINSIGSRKRFEHIAILTREMYVFCFSYFNSCVTFIVYVAYVIIMQSLL